LLFGFGSSPLAVLPTPATEEISDALVEEARRKFRYVVMPAPI
jgi:hypothetical protein